MLKLSRNPSRQQRTCLRCDRTFLSFGPHNRLCQACRETLEASSTPEEAYPLLLFRDSISHD
jgi:hypothetical protein